MWISLATQRVFWLKRGYGKRGGRKYKIPYKIQLCHQLLIVHSYIYMVTGMLMCKYANVQIEQNQFAHLHIYTSANFPRMLQPARKCR
jgi:hypothetical protein